MIVLIHLIDNIKVIRFTKTSFKFHKRPDTASIVYKGQVIAKTKILKLDKLNNDIVFNDLMSAYTQINDEILRLTNLVGYNKSKNQLLKLCTNCNEILPLDKFTKNGRNRGNYRQDYSSCMDCRTNNHKR